MARELEIEIQETEEAPFAPEVAEAEQADKELFAEVSPKGRFSSKALNALVDASNKLLPVFDQSPDYPKFDAGTYEVWPEDFVRVISMFSEAAKDAATSDVVPVELSFSLEGVVDDQDLQVIAGKVQSLADSRDFRKWLKEPQEVEAPAPVSDEAGGDVPEQDIEDLFLSRV